jgi:membrane-associated phospholipid phosphatase
VAAIPWLNLARSAPNRPARLLALLGSLLTGWSRMNDRMHYLSQIVLGYGIAWMAVAAVRGAAQEPVVDADAPSADGRKNAPAPEA